MGVGGQRYAPAALPQGKRPGTHFTGGWVGPRAVLDACGKSRPPPGFNPRTVQPVASRYTNWAIPAHTYCRVYVINCTGHTQKNGAVSIVNSFETAPFFCVCPVYHTSSEDYTPRRECEMLRIHTTRTIRHRSTSNSTTIYIVQYMILWNF